MALVAWTTSSGSPHMTGPLLGLRSCPRCAIAEPRLELLWSSKGQMKRVDGGLAEYWGAFSCATCGGVVTASSPTSGKPGSTAPVKRTLPAERTAHEDLPQTARTFLQQAYQTLAAPDAATVMAASAVDAMLKEIGYADGTLNSRIRQALQDSVITQGMADWAHAVRLEANNVRHSDAQKPHASPEEALQAVDFAEALGNFLFVLKARVERGIESAKAAGEESPKETA